MRKAWMLGMVAVVSLFIVGPTVGQEDESDYESTYESTTVTTTLSASFSGMDRGDSRVHPPSRQGGGECASSSRATTTAMEGQTWLYPTG